VGSTPEKATDLGSPDMVEAFTFRAITSADIAVLAASVAEAFARYRSFAPDAWQPPTADSEADVLEHWLDDPDFWGEVALEQSTLVGHATFIPAARHSFRPEPDANVAHLGHLFVTPEYWGFGAATQLLGRAANAARARGLTSMRLFIPEGQARARRFYEREGFNVIGEPFEFGLGLSVLECRRRQT
jgi:GNAT superfamily N-acetyltransferase